MIGSVRRPVPARGTRRRLVALAVLAVAGMLLAGCDPAAMPQPGRVEVDVTVEPAGSVHVDIYPGLRTPVSRTDLDRMATGVATAIFAAGTRTATGIVSNGAGVAYPVIDAFSVYRPGRDPAVTIDARTLGPVLGKAGFTTVELSVCAPDVPATFTATPAPYQADSSCVTWDDVGSGAPRVLVETHPSAAGWLFATGLLALAAASAVIALILIAARRFPPRRRVLAACLAGAGVAGSVAAVVVPNSSPDNLGMLGYLSGVPLTLAGLAGFAVLPLLPGSVLLLTAALVRRPNVVSGTTGAAVDPTPLA